MKFSNLDEKMHVEHSRTEENHVRENKQASGTQAAEVAADRVIESENRTSRSPQLHCMLHHPMQELHPIKELSERYSLQLD